MMPQIMFASQLSAFSVPMGKSPATVSIKDSEGIEIFRNRYDTEMPFVIRGLSKIINGDLRTKSASSGNYTIGVSRPDDQPATDNGQHITIIYNELWERQDIDAEEFLENHFMLETREITVPAAITNDINIEIWTKAPESCRITQIWTEQGEEKSAVLDYPVAPGGDVITIYAAFARDHAPMAVLLECGKRTAVVKFTTEECSGNTRLFTFRNIFNASESLWLTGVLKESPAAEKTVAEINGQKKILDIERNTSYTMTVSGLSISQALRARRMLYSRQTEISHIFSSDNGQRKSIPIIIDDVSGNISDDRSQLCDITIKFSTLIPDD